MIKTSKNQRTRNRTFVVYPESVVPDWKEKLEKLYTQSLISPLHNKDQVDQLNLKDKVFFAGLQEDVAPFLSAMDAFIMPSLFEGLPYVLVEAQTSGLPIYCSDTIDKDIKLTDLVTFLPLNDRQKWVDTILNQPLLQRQSRQKEMIEQGYDLKSSLNKIQEFYNRN
ncbi:MAG TPA: glycosyltransferase [Erysipelothrix sp.]|nr:glycosyltransferase [Erysipelothrix sp.]